MARLHTTLIDFYEEIHKGNYILRHGALLEN